MKTTPKRLLGLLLAVLLIMMIQPLVALADDDSNVPPQATIVASSKDPDSDIGLDWELDSNGVLTLSKIEGTDGVSYDYNGKEEDENYYTKSPLYDWKDQVTSVVIKDGVTVLGYRLLRDFEKIKTVQFPASLKEIKSDCFRACTSITEITLPEKLENLARTAFFGCTSLKKVVLNGTYTDLWDKTFQKCTSLSEIVWNAPTTAFHGDALTGCQLEKITYYGTMEQWESLLASKGYKTTEPGKAKGDLICRTDVLKDGNITVICSDSTYIYGSQEGNTDNDKIKSGTTSDVNWTLDLDTGKLTLTAPAGSSGKTAVFTKDDYNKTDDNGKYINELYGLKDQIKTIVVGEGVTYLGDYLLYGAAATSVSFPSTLTTIGESCFYSSGLTSVTIPANVTTIGAQAFQSCASLKTAVINANITVLKDRVFGNCQALTTVNLPDTLKSFEIVNVKGKDKNAFTACSALTIINYTGTIEEYNKLLANNDVTTLKKDTIFVSCSDGNCVYNKTAKECEKVSYLVGLSNNTKWKLDLEAGKLTLSNISNFDGVAADYSDYKSTPFYPYKDQIKSVVVEKGVTVLGYRMFRAIGMESVTLPEGLLEIKSDCFRECPNLKEIVLPNSLTNLARTAFFNCTGLEKVVLNGEFTDIWDKTFQKCTKLKKIEINAPITTIHGSAFTSDASITSITYNGTIKDWIKLLDTTGYATTEKAVFVDGVPCTAETVNGEIVYTPLSKTDASGTSTLKKDYITVHCKDGDYIYGRVYLTDTFYYYINNGALIFEGNGEIPNYEAGKAPWAADASTITSIIIVGDISSIGENAFADCTNVTTVCYPGTEEAWNAMKENHVASGNDPLLNAAYASTYAGSIGDNVKWSFDPETCTMTYSGTGAMYDYTSRKNLPYFHLLGKVKSVVVEEGVTTVGNYAFQYMTSLTSVKLPESLKIVGTFAFGYCEKLTELTIPEGVTHIGSKTFVNCELTTLNLPSTLKYIDMKSFDGASIVDVYYNGTKADWALIEISSQAQGNANLLASNIHYLADLTISDIASDVTDEAWYAEHILYLYNQGLLTIDNKTVSPTETNNLNWLLNMLYIRAGQSGQYENASDWAVSNGIIAKDAANTLSLSDLALVLYRTAVYNGQAAAGGDEIALEWLETQKYDEVLNANVTDLDKTKALTRGEIASVVAAYFGSKAGTADRDDVILAEIKSIIEKGGDNKLHIVSLDAPSGATKAGDSTLIIFPNGEVMLLDALTSAKDNLARLTSILDRAGITSIDYLVNSHAHSDHIGNFEAIIEHIYSKGGTVGCYYAAYGENYTPTTWYTAATKTKPASGLKATLQKKGITIKTDLREGDVLTIGGVTINIYSPSQAFLDETTGTTDEPVNNTSMVMKFTYGKSTYLTCGDIYRARERYLVDTYGDAIQADVLKLNHHGCYTSNSMDWIHATDAKIMFAPSDDVGDSILKDAVSAEGRAYYSNGCDGLIHISMDDDANYEVETRYDSNNRSTFVPQPEEEPGDDGNTDNGGNTGNDGNTNNGGNTGNDGNTNNGGNTGNDGNTNNGGNTGNDGNTNNGGNTDNDGNTNNGGNTDNDGNTNNGGNTGNDGNTNNGGNTGNDGNKPDDSNKDNEKTGDGTPVILLTIVAALSLCAAAWMLLKKDRKF